jgi:hypothetical protein
VGRGLFGSSENTSRFNDVVGISLTPRNFSGVQFVENTDGLSANADIGLVNRADFSRVHSMGGVVFEHVLNVVSQDERVVNSDNVDHGVVLGCVHDKAANKNTIVSKNKCQNVEFSTAQENVEYSIATEFP